MPQFDVKMDPKIGRGDSLLGKPWVFSRFQSLPVVQFRGCNYFGITGSMWWTTSRGYSFMFEQLRVSDRFGISDDQFLGDFRSLAFLIWSPIAFGVFFYFFCEAFNIIFVDVTLETSILGTKTNSVWKRPKFHIYRRYKASWLPGLLLILELVLPFQRKVVRISSSDLVGFGEEVVMW